MLNGGGVFTGTGAQARITLGICCQFGNTVSDKMVLRSCWKSRHKISYGPGPFWIRPALIAVLCLYVSKFACGNGAVGETKHVVQKDAEFDVTYNDTVTSENQTIYAFNHTVSRNKTEGVRVSVDVLSQVLESPILFVVRQKQNVLSFQVPLILRGLYQRKYPYNHVGRTLCQPPTRVASETQYFFVDVSTLSSQGTNYKLRVSRVESFTLQTDKKFNFTASPSQPQVYTEAYVMGMLFCLGIFLSFYLLTLLVACVEKMRMNKKREVFQNPADMSPAETASLLGKNRDGRSPVSPYEYGSIADNGSTLSSEAITDSATSTDNNYGYMGQELFKRRPILNHLHHLAIHIERSLESVGRSRQESLSSVEEDDYDTLEDIDSDKNIVRTKKYLCVADLSRKDKRVLNKKYQIYFWNIATIAVFYALPVVQLVITYQTVVNVTGNQDICYYNFLCAHPLGALSAFNNILSNLGYVMLGLLFLLIVLRRDIVHSRALLRNSLNALECGIPKHFGLFYAMGTALMMEGLLSACYHVCPNYTNFQFDTSFMYMIAGLCMLKLYQKRHPDINASAYTAYACLAMVIFFSVLGVVFGKGNTAFWIVFSVIHILATLLLSTQLYYMGRWRLDSGILRRIVYVIYTDCIRQCSGPMYIDRMVLLVMGNIVNWSLAAYGLIVKPNDFASYLLAIAICNLLLYFAFYIIMKLRSGERIQCLPLVCILFTAVVGGFALYFFFQGLSTWEKTPAESREHNRDCILLSFFDDHDIWHFLSSIAMFGSFLVLLTMDDDLDTVQRDKIYVF
uniref:SID1 transmembrane family member 2 n=1 Tax=Monopterus albus TaxID=43700 RepID=UPI0009B4880B|nr:SID1 transmembrane family member 2 [Monopterus albus]